MQVRPPHPPGEVAEGILTTVDFVECYKAHYRRLVRALRLGGADAPTAEDVAQEAFARALMKWRRISKGSNPPGYVYTTAFRLLQRSQRRSTPSASTAQPSSSPTESEATIAVTLERALAAMPPKRRACAVMCLLVGLTPHQAGDSLGIADGTVRKHLEEARRDLRVAMGPTVDDGDR